MDELLSEKEQIEKMRTWWSDYGAYVIAGVVLGAAVLFGINYYQNSTREAQVRASALYDTLTDHIVDGDMDAAEAVAGEIAVDFSDSAYAPQAKLAIARLYMDQNRDKDAADTLAELIANDTENAFKLVARIRLAKIYLYQGKPDEAIDLLDGEGNEAFAARFADVLGDAYVALGDYAQARSEYQRALSEPNQAATLDQRFVQLKLLDLPVESAVDASPATDTANAATGDEVTDEQAADPEATGEEVAGDEAIGEVAVAEETE